MKILLITIVYIMFSGNIMASPHRYTLGSMGEAGGLVFYVTKDGQHGIEVGGAETEDESVFEWGCMGLNIPNASETKVLAGKTNTDSIVNFDTNSIRDSDSICYNYRMYRITAWKIAKSINLHFGDWYLPSKEEMQLVYANLFIQRQAGFHFYDKSKPRCYWTSSMSGGDKAWAIYLDGITPGVFVLLKKDELCYIRSVRSF